MWINVEYYFNHGRQTHVRNLIWIRLLRRPHRHHTGWLRPSAAQCPLDSSCRGHQRFIQTTIRPFSSSTTTGRRAWNCRNSCSTTLSTMLPGGAICPPTTGTQISCTGRSDEILRECPSKPWRLHCLAVPTGTEVSRRCVDDGATAGAGGYGWPGSR